MAFTTIAGVLLMLGLISFLLVIFFSFKTGLVPRVFKILIIMVILILFMNSTQFVREQVQNETNVGDSLKLIDNHQSILNYTFYVSIFFLLMYMLYVGVTLIQLRNGKKNQGRGF